MTPEGTVRRDVYGLASTSWGTEELGAIRRVLDSGWLTMGENVRQFETAFAAHFGMRHAAMLNSGSSANLVAVAALSHKRERPLCRGDEVIVPAISWATTYHPLQQYGLKLRFVDVELETLNLDVSQLAAALTPRTRAVVAVSILGNPAPLDRIRDFCNQHNLYLFEDNCESAGARLDGRLCGTFGHVNTFSTFFSHQLSTMEGGMLVTDDPEIDQLARVIRNHGWTRDLPADSPLHGRAPRASSPHRGDVEDDFREAYRFVLPGYNLRPLEICGAIGVEQLKKLDAVIDARRANAGRFVELFGRDERFIIQREHGAGSWFAFTLILNPALPIERRRVLAALREADIEFRMITGGCFPRHPAIRFFDHEIVGGLPNANLAHDRGFFVGNHPRDLTRELTRLRQVLDAAVR
jgi:CDP-6-deoxy-D-xylo-4-hexulose-3-dehydrase